MALTSIGVLESLFPFTMRVGLMHEKLWVVSWFLSTGNDRYSGHGYSGIDRYSGTKISKISGFLGSKLYKTSFIFKK